MDFASKADRSAQAGESARDAHDGARALAARLVSGADQALKEAGQEAVSYLLRAGVEPVPVGRILEPSIGSKKERFEQTGRAWAIAPVINLFLNGDGTWSVYTLKALRVFQMRRTPLSKAYGSTMSAGHGYPVQPTPLNGDCFQAWTGFVRAEVPHSGSSLVDHLTTLSFGEAGCLSIQEPGRGTMGFSDWVAERAGQLAAGR